MEQPRMNKYRIYLLLKADFEAAQAWAENLLNRGSVSYQLVRSESRLSVDLISDNANHSRHRLPIPDALSLAIASSLDVVAHAMESLDRMKKQLDAALIEAAGEIEVLQGEIAEARSRLAE
jgi:uncharacterized protein YutE (UPF0331/DUF86 family)